MREICAAEYGLISRVQAREQCLSAKGCGIASKPDVSCRARDASADTTVPPTSRQVVMAAVLAGGLILFVSDATAV